MIKLLIHLANSLGSSGKFLLSINLIKMYQKKMKG